jgi:hypothetical protein
MTSVRRVIRHGILPSLGSLLRFGVVDLLRPADFVSSFDPPWVIGRLGLAL